MSRPRGVALCILALLSCTNVRSAETVPLTIDACEAIAWQGSPEPSLDAYTPPAGRTRKAVLLAAPRRKDATWSRPCGTDLSRYKAICLQVACSSPVEGTLRVKASRGWYKCDLSLESGEQYAILPLSTFARDANAGEWFETETLELMVAATRSGAELRLLSVQALPQLKPPVGEQPLLFQRYSRVNSQAMAYPLYAILGNGKTLQRYIPRLCGVSLPLNPKGLEIGPGLTNVILVGKDAALAAGTVTARELAPWGPQGFIVKATASSVTIAGNTSHGDEYGSYQFLEKQDCRFYAVSCETIPQKADRLLRACAFTDKPFYNVKGCTSTYSIRGWNYKLLGDPRLATKAMGEEKLFDKTLWLDHTAGYLVPTKLYQEKHPEYYSDMGDGTHLPKDLPMCRVMLCLTHPDVLRISAKRMCDWIASQPDRYYFVCAQGDGPDWCNCERCRKAGNKADQTLVWANYVARAVARKFPDKILITHAYNGADTPPLHMKPEKNLSIMYAAWPNETSTPDGIRDFDAPENIVARTHLAGWLKVAPGQMGLYDYNGGSRYSVYGMAWRVKWGAKHDMHSIWYCGQNKSFADLFTFVHSRLTWDPWEDVGRLKNEFIHAYYGKAAPVVRQVFDLIYDRLEQGDYDARMLSGAIPPPDFFDLAFVEKAFGLFNQALALSQDNRRAHDDLVHTKKLFISNALRLAPGRKGERTDDQYRAYARVLREYIDWAVPDGYAAKVAKLKKQKKKIPAFSYGGVISMVERQTYVDLGKASKPDQLPPLLAEMLKNPKDVIEKHRNTYFVETIQDGWRIPGKQFEGGRNWGSYAWFCPKRVDCASIYGTMTEWSRMKALVRLDKNAPDRAGVIEIEGQDTEKTWCSPVRIQVYVNRTKVFDGRNEFVKRGWKRVTYPLPKGALKKGDNIVEIRNLASTDSSTSHWVMISEVRLRFPKE